MKKIIALITAVITVLSCFAACSETDGTTAEESSVNYSDKVKEQTVTLGASELSLTTNTFFAKSELTADSADEYMIASYHSDNSAVEFDVYQWLKTSDETVSDAIGTIAGKYKAKAKTSEINGLEVAYFDAKAEKDGEKFNVSAYAADDGIYSTVIVFRFADDNAQSEADAMIGTLAMPDAQTDGAGETLNLGTSSLKICPSYRFIKGELTAEDADTDKVAYFYSKDIPLTFSVYRMAKADGETLSDAVNKEAKPCGGVPKDVRINGISASYFTASYTDGSSVRNTVTYIVADGNDFIKVVFGLDGDNALSQAEAVMNTLSK